MLRLRESILSPSLHHLLSVARAPTLHRFLSVTGAPISQAPAGFAVEDYLIATCGLSRMQALKASSKLSHLRSASKPDAVLAFLADLGLPKTDITAVVAKDPQFLCASVKRTLGPIVIDLTDLGLSRPEIARLILFSPKNFRYRSIGSKLMFREALECVMCKDREEKISAHMEYLKKTFWWSDAEVRIAISMTPFLLKKSKEMMQCRSEFLLSEVGLEPAYIARRSTMLSLSLEGQLRPRYYVAKFLKAI